MAVPRARIYPSRIHPRSTIALADFEIHSLCLSHPRVLGAYTLDPSSFLESGKVARLVAILDDLRSRGSRPLIFSQWTSMLSIIEAVLNQKARQSKDRC